jgi:tetratricopeptide (TPR) repeat protein
LLAIADEELGTPTQAIRAGNVEVSRNELFTRLTMPPASEWYNKDISLERRGKYSEDIQSYDRALQLDPNRASARDDKAQAEKELIWNL